MLVITPVAILVGVAIGFILLLVYELLHAIVYPKSALVTIGKMKGKLIFVALASYPLQRNRFILMCLLPFVLGILPLLIFMISLPNALFVNGILFGMACMGMISPYYMDVYNVRLVLKQTKSSDKIMFYDEDMCIK